MPKPGMVWRQVILSTRSSWLPGDERGWRSRNHKRHSSGDYKSPPPKGEHEGLRHYTKKRSRQVVDIPWNMRARLGLELLKQFQRYGIPILSMSISKRHAHALMELPEDYKEMRRLVGLCKGASSHAVRDQMPGGIWAEGGKYLIIGDKAYQLNVYDYILYKQGRGAFTWSFRDSALVFIPGRKRPACRTNVDHRV